MTVTHQRLSATDFAVTPATLHAQAVLADIDRDRLVVDRLRGGLTQEVVAKELGISQATVHRIAKRRERIEAEAAEPTAIEIIARHCISQITHAQMMGDLLSRTYTRGFIPEGSYDGYVRGTWDDIEFGRSTGMLSESDFEALLEKAPK